MTQPRPNLSRAWRRTFWQVYDNLGLLLAVNILWLLLSITLVGFPTATAALFYISYLIVLDMPVRLKDFFSFLLEKFIISTCIILILVVVIFFLFFNIRFYSHHFGITGLILGGISFWLLIFFLLTSLYIFPLLCRYNSLRDILKYSLILNMDNLKTSLILFITTLILLSIGVIIPIISFAVLSVFTQNLFLEIQCRYNPNLAIDDPRRKFKDIWKMWNFS